MHKFAIFVSVRTNFFHIFSTIFENMLIFAQNERNSLYIKPKLSSSIFKCWNFVNKFLFVHLEKQIDLSAVDLKKLKVRDLKKILNDWDENCEGCLEKTDYIRRIEELKPKYYKESDKKDEF